MGLTKLFSIVFEVLGKDGANMTYSDAWLKAIEEYNGYGFASRDPKQRIDRTQASLMLGFKAWISKPQNMVQTTILT